jgi:hypothetical protein
MRKLAVIIASIGLAGCGGATAATSGTYNPAQCLASFEYDATVFKLGNMHDKVAQYLARGMYVMGKVKSDGGSPAKVLTEAKQYSRDHAADSKQMDALHMACGKALAQDPTFRAEFPGLIERARPLVPKFEAAASP